MKKIPCISNCRKAAVTLVAALTAAWGLAGQAGERSSSLNAGAGEGEKLSIRQVELFIRDNPAAPWRPAKQRGGLVFNNDCTVRIACELAVSAHAPAQQIVQSVVLKKGDRQVALLDRQRPAEVLRERDTVKTVSTVLFPCFQAAPAWLKRGEPVVVTVIVFLGKSEVSASVNPIYDLAE